MSILDNISLGYRKCPAGKWHRITKDDPDCGHTGQVLEWCEPYQRWVPNPIKTEQAKQLLQEDEMFQIEREARERIQEALKKGNIQPAIDYRRKLLS